MNIEEAVQYFNDEIRLCRAAPSINGCQMTEDWQRTIDACEIAVAAIRKVSNLDMARGERDVVTKRMIELEQETVTNRNGENEPLTLDDLRKMDGEPVWIVEYPDWGHWELSADADDYVADRDADFYGMKHNDPAGRYGLHKLGWLAYRHKPEEDDHDA